MDETHKDRNTSRKRRGWSKHNSYAVITSEQFQNVVRYTLIGAKVIMYTNSKIKSELYADKIEEYFNEKGFSGDVIMINGALESSEKVS